MYQYPFYLLKTRRFLPFFITQFFGALNDNIFKLSVLTLIAFHLTTNPVENQIYQATGAFLFTLPFFLFSATAGQLADKYDKIFLMRCIKCIEVIFMIVGAVAIYQQSIFSMFFVIFLMGLHSAFFGPLKYAILPEHLQQTEWLAGNAFVEAGTFMAILIGTMSGTILIPQNHAFLQQGLMLASMAIISVACLGAISSFFIPSAKPLQPDLTIDWHFFRSMRAVIGESRKYSMVFPAIMGISWFWFMGASFLTEFPAYVEYTLAAEKNVFTLFLMLFSIGIGIGSLLGSHWLKGEISGKHVSVAILGMSLFTMDVYFQSPSTLSILPINPITLLDFLSHVQGCRITIDFFLLAICGGIYIVPLYALIQKNSPVQWRSRMIAANNIMNALLMVFSAIWIALLAFFKLTMPVIFLSLAILNVIMAFYLLCLVYPKKSTFLKYLLKFLYRVEVHGMEHYKAASDQFLIILNYTSFMDVILLTVFLPDFLGVAVEDQLIKKFWMKPFLALANVFPVKAFSSMISRDIINAAQKSQKFILFPEGYLKEGSSLKQIYESSGFVVRETGFSILPIQIEGASFLPFSRMKGKMLKRWFPKIILNILPAYSLTVPFDYDPRQSRRWIANQLFKQTTEMMFNTSPWKRSLFEMLLEMQKIHGKFSIAGDIHQASVNYTDIVTRSFILGSIIAKRTERGEHVGILLPTMVNTMICFFALQAFGRVPAMLNFSIGSQSLKDTCLLAKIKTVYTSRVFVEQAKLSDLIMALLDIHVTVIYLEDCRKTLSLMDKVKGWLRGAMAPWFIGHYKIESTLPAVVLFTSGSEGVPKGVVLSHQNILANIYQIGACVDFSFQDCLFNALPVFHCFGLTIGALLPLLQGFSVFFYPSPLHYRIVPEWVNKSNATIFLATDTFLNGYAHYANSYDFHKIRYIFAGAEKVKEETMKTWMSSFSTCIFEGYGVTEAAPVIAVNHAMLHKAGSVGCPLPGIRSKITSFENFSSGGRLWISGPNVMMGYLMAENPGILVPLKDGWHDTGDIATFDEEGYLTLLGRARRFAKIGGEMVSLQAVESVIITLSPEYFHAVLNIPDPKKGEQLVWMTNYPEANREELAHYMRSRGYSELFIPKKIRILPEMPVLGSGKMDYLSLHKFIKDVENT